MYNELVKMFYPFLIDKREYNIDLESKNLYYFLYKNYIRVFDKDNGDYYMNQVYDFYSCDTIKEKVKVGQTVIKTYCLSSVFEICKGIELYQRLIEDSLLDLATLDDLYEIIEQKNRVSVLINNFCVLYLKNIKKIKDDDKRKKALAKTIRKILFFNRKKINEQKLQFNNNKFLITKLQGEEKAKQLEYKIEISLVNYYKNLIKLAILLKKKKLAKRLYSILSDRCGIEITKDYLKLAEKYDCIENGTFPIQMSEDETIEINI